MPYRKIVIRAGEIYHVYNRSIAKQPIFLSQRDYERAIETINFYRHKNPPLRFSHYKRLATEAKERFMENLKTNIPVTLKIFAFCLMPNHYHFLLSPTTDASISSFIRNFQDSYAKYFNTKNERVGSLFQAMFKAVRIETDEQLLHVSRYIHLNPVSSLMLKTESLAGYPWTSFREYLGGKNHKFVDTKEILSFFKPKDKYKEFVLDQADYQKELEKIKHLMLEKP